MTQISCPTPRLIADTIAALPPGERAEGYIHVGERASGAQIAIPYVIVRGARPGPTLWLNGQVHGNEIAAIVAGHVWLNGLDRAQLAGTIVFTTTGNPLALDGRAMFSPQDWGNLDQSFPGRPDGFITERLAWRLWQEIAGVRPDLLISMHSQGTEAESEIYAVFKQPPESTVAPEALFPFIRLFEPHVVCRMRIEPGSGEIPGNHGGALDYVAMAHDIPAFMVELGTGLRAPPEVIEQGVSCFSRVARQLGLTEGSPASGVDASRLVTRRGHLTVDRGGFFLATCRAAQIVPAGQPLGTIVDQLGRTVETVTQDHDVLIISIRIDPVVHSGDNVAYVAHAWSDLALI